jgi:hypothetical protein
VLGQILHRQPATGLSELISHCRRATLESSRHQSQGMRLAVINHLVSARNDASHAHAVPIAVAGTASTTIHYRKKQRWTS